MQFTLSTIRLRLKIISNLKRYLKNDPKAYNDFKMMLCGELVKFRSIDRPLFHSKKSQCSLWSISEIQMADRVHLDSQQS